MSTIRVQSPGMTPNRPERCWNELDHKDFLRWVKIWGSEIEASYWLRAKNRGLSLVEKTWLKNSRHSPSLQKSLPFHSFQTAISTIRLHLHNQTAISTIRLQSPQSMIRFYHVVHIGVHIPECVKHPAHCLRLQSQQSDCNLSNQTAILLHCSLIVEVAGRLWRLQSDCKDCCLIVEIAVWLWRLPSGMSGMREISEQKANALNFLNPVLSTNQRPWFSALIQWEVCISARCQGCC